MVFVLKPYTESFLAVVAVAFRTIFIVDVPAGNVLISAIALCQFKSECSCVFLIYQ